MLEEGTWVAESLVKEAGAQLWMLSATSCICATAAKALRASKGSESTCARLMPAICSFDIAAN
jgi:hypothetical protein